MQGILKGLLYINKLEGASRTIIFSAAPASNCTLYLIIDDMPGVGDSGVIELGKGMVAEPWGAKCIADRISVRALWRVELARPDKVECCQGGKRPSKRMTCSSVISASERSLHLQAIGCQAIAHHTCNSTICTAMTASACILEACIPISNDNSPQINLCRRLSNEHTEITVKHCA